MSRFKKFINSESLKSNPKKREQTGNAFKRKKRNKRFYKSKLSNEELQNKMKEKGATISAYSLMDAINSKTNQVKKNNYDLKKEKTQIVNNKKKELVIESNEKEKEAMKNFVLARYYEEEDEENEQEESDEDITYTQNVLTNSNKKKDIISF